ncbi:MAG: FAD-dependent oxidoreductase [Acidocella sp.]|nr:FAD-dependent oxidoreductase [Acidocella sp.]
MKRIVLVGAGHAHIVVLRHFALHKPNATLTLINDGAYAYYTGALPAAVRGDITPEQARIDVQKLATACGARFINARYTGFENNFANLDEAASVPFDTLAISVGAKSVPDGIKPIAKFFDRLRRWERLPAARLGIIGCGASGVELALALRARLNRNAKIYLQTGDGQVLPNAPRRVRDIARTELARARITLSKAIPYPLDDVIHAYAPAPNIAVRETLQLMEHDNIFATGDCAAFPNPLPNSGAIAVRQGRVLLHNLLANKMQKFRPPLATLAIMSLDSHKAVAWYGTDYISGWLPMLLKNWLDRRWLRS